MNMSSEAESFSISDPLTVPELEHKHIYHEVVLKQDFYSDSYGCEWTPESYEDMTKMPRDVIAPTKHVDVGCGKWFLVSAMRRLGISSFGIDFNKALVRQAPDEIKPYVEVLTIEDWIHSLFGRQFFSNERYFPLHS
jgi:hypothetical protein